MARTKARNWVPAAILRSPLHPLLSGKTALLTFRGRRSGRTFSTPVTYVRERGSIVAATDSSWWRNFTDTAPARLRLRGREEAVIGQAVTDPDEAAAALALLIRGAPSYGRFAGVEVRDGQPDDDDVRAAVAGGRVPIRFHLPASA